MKKEERFVYSSLDQVLLSGKYKGMKIRDVVISNRSYMTESVRHQTFHVTSELRVQIVELRKQYVDVALNDRSVSERNSGYGQAVRAVEQTRIAVKETKEPCIHDKCWCAHHGCRHVGRKTCDMDNMIEIGSKEKEMRKYT